MLRSLEDPGLELQRHGDLSSSILHTAYPSVGFMSIIFNQKIEDEPWTYLDLKKKKKKVCFSNIVFFIFWYQLPRCLDFFF